MSSPTRSTARSEPYRAGDEIAGKYRLERILGEGGMGAVWAATNLLLDAPVAIKLIRGDLSRDAFAARLLQEARAAARLGHPAIVRVFDVGETSHGDPFIVMELLQGRSLSSLLMDEGRLTSVRALQLLLPIAEALALAHSKGIVHRDLKPDNVFLVEDDGQLQPKLVDFGIAKLEPRPGTSQLTHHGVVLGSPEYMSPEQARGDANLDARSDIWSFTVMLYEALTGVLPFTGANYNAQLRSILEDTPKDIRDHAAGDFELSLTVATGLTKDREQRFQTMNDLGAALAQWLIVQGVLQDVCGVSLQSKWIDRRSDSSTLARASRSSIADAGPPYSGVRPTGARPMAATTPAARTPVALAGRTGVPLTERRVFRFGIPLAVIVALGATTLALLREGSPEARDEHAAGKAVAAPAAPREATPPVTAELPSPLRPAPSGAAVEKVDSTPAATPATSPKVTKRAPPRAKKDKPAPPAEQKPPLDLIAPY